ncbi:MAG: DUF393 domain-containing protein [Pseudomonadota bacterium]
MIQHYQNIVWFFAIIAPIALAARFHPATAKALAAMTNGICRLSLARGGLPGSIDEIPKFAVIRIILGLILLNRAYWIAYYAYPGDFETLTFVVALGVSVLVSVMLIVGFSVQWGLIVLCVFQWQVGESYLSSSTLGNDIAAMLALLLFLTGAGRRISVDSRLLRRWPGLAAWMLYFELDDQSIVQAKFLTLTAYWLVCIYSLVLHLAEPAWMEGFAGPQLLTNNFMSAWYAEFETLFVEYPVSIYLAIGSMWVMLPWYGGVLPFVLLGGYLRLFIIIWGLMFFAVSLFVLNLGWLAEFEFLFWAGLFLYRSGKVDLIYDDRCNLCDRTVNLVKRLDLLDTVRLKPITQNLEWAAGLGLDYDSVHRDLHGVDGRTGEVYKGYDLYILLTRSVILLAVLWPVMILGKALRIGPAIYRRIADNRIKVFGVCTLPTPKPSWSIGALSGLPRFPIGAVVVVHFMIFAVGYAIAIPAPHLGWPGIQNKLTRYAHIYGVTPINVFNKTDLRMTENWFTIETEQGDLLPIFNRDGSRGAYHRSDRLYFGGTVLFRRGFIDQGGCFYEDPLVTKLTTGIAGVYNGLTGEPGPFVYTQYYRKIADPNGLLEMRFQQNDVEIRCKKSFTLSSID